MLVRNPCLRDARVLREAGALAEAGHDVVVLATAEDGVPTTENRDGFRITRVEPVPAWMPRLARRQAVPLQSSASIASSNGRRRAWMALARDRVVSRRMTAAADALPADVYHAHDLNTLEAAIAAARSRGARVVFDAHELYPDLAGLTAPESRRWKRLERALIGEAARVITVSESLADELERRHGIPRPLVLMNVPARPASPPDPASSPLNAVRHPDEILVLYIGSLLPNRGLEALVDATAEAKGWRLAVMGWGVLEAALRRRGARVAFVAPVPPHEVVNACAGADVGIVPFLPVGLNNSLALPNKLFEYAHAGLAVAVSDLVELRRFVQAHGAGVVFEPGSTPAIVRALNDLAADRTRLGGMRSAALKSARSYDWTHEKRKLVDLYGSLLRR